MSDDGAEMLDPKMIGKKKKAAEGAGKGARATTGSGGAKRKPDSKLEEMEKMDFENMTEEQIEK